MDQLSDHLVLALRTAAQSFAAGDQTPPCAVLWPDPERQWESVVSVLSSKMSELFVLGVYAPERRMGPALWLRCIEARVLGDVTPGEAPPIFYLPGVGRDQLRAVEECSPELSALVELQFRGVTWLHVNGREWSPYAFLTSKHSTTELDIARDQATLEALSDALPIIMEKPLSQLQGRRLDSEFFNALLAPDSTGSLLRWLSDSEAFKGQCSDAQWKAFCAQSKVDFGIDPSKEGPLKAAKLLTERSNSWGRAWLRFAESPMTYPGIIDWIRRAAPRAPSMFDSAEVWPDINEIEERDLHKALGALRDLPQDEVAGRVAELEAKHSARRAYTWQKLGLSTLATALKPLAQLAEMCQSIPGAPDVQAYAEFYANDGWRIDDSALAAMAAQGSPEQHSAVLAVVRSLYLPWLESTARHLQQLVRENGRTLSKRFPPISLANGRIVMFVDGLRMDIAHQLFMKLAAKGIETALDWDWSTIPSVTATAKPAASPIAHLVQGCESAGEFTARLVSRKGALTHGHFTKALIDSGWQVLSSCETGDPSGSAWSESGALDKRGHSEGWKLARSIETEVADLLSRIHTLLQVGWKEVFVVTDHGWLLMPGGLPKVELKAHLTENRWGRCASLKEGVATDEMAFKWSWNPQVMIASPPGAACFRGGLEYSHGGISLQEVVIPVLRICSHQPAGGSARLLEAKWVGAKCRVSVGGSCDGAHVDIRQSPYDSDTSLLSDSQARKTKADGTVTLFLEDDSCIGTKAEIVLLDAVGQVLDSRPITLGE